MASKERLDALLGQFVKAGIPGCGLSVSYRGRIVYTGYCGLADRENGIPIDEDTVYTVASCTKTLTATAAMKMYEEGKFLLDDPVYEYLPSFRSMSYQTFDPSGETIVKPVTKPITIRHLLSMTSGIPYMGRGSLTAREYLEKIGGMYTLPLRELAQKISEIPLQFDPGTHFHYGFSYDVLAAVMEEIAGKPYAEYLKEAVLEPLGMEHTAFVLTEEMQRHRAITYRMTADGPQRLERKSTPEEQERMKGGYGGGGLSSTLGDLVKLAGLWGNGGVWEGKRLLSRNTLDLMRKNQLSGQAYEDFRLMAEEAYPWYRGYSWGLAGRTCVSPEEAGSNGSVGEFGWCGATGPYILGDPGRQLGVAYTMQTSPVIGGFQDYAHPRIRNAVYALLDEWDEEIG